MNDLKLQKQSNPPPKNKIAVKKHKINETLISLSYTKKALQKGILI